MMDEGVTMVWLRVLGRSRLAVLSVAALLTLLSTAAAASSASAAPAWKGISLGADHACAIRWSDGSLLCWGNNKYGQATPPEGAFTTVAAGGLYTCGIRGFTPGEITGRAVCWGRNRYGEATPEPNFKMYFALSAGEVHTCGIREQDRRPTAGSIVCWGFDGSISQPPDGKFVSLSAGSSHTCAIRVGDGSIACWGDDFHGESSPPAGSFAAVSAGPYHTCAIRSTDRSIVCWGDNSDGELNAPTGSFSSLSAGNDFNCAVRTGEHTIACWGYGVHGETTPPAGAFDPYPDGISARGAGVCAIREGYGSIACWGYTPGPPPTGPGLLPVFVNRATVTPRGGTVRLEAPGAKRFIVLNAAKDVGVGALVNATRGRVQVTAAVHRGSLRSLTIRGGTVRLSQIQRGGLQVRAVKSTVTVYDPNTRRTIRLRTGQTYTAR
jgi:hypothetical protein